MEAYVLWLEQLEKFKYTWIHSGENINCFVLHAIPPGHIYSTKHTLIWPRRSDCAADHRCASTTARSLSSSRTVRPSSPHFLFNTEKLRENYPVDLDFDHDFGKAVAKMKTSLRHMDVLDSFEILSYKLHDFKRVSILRVVKSMESTGFGILHNGGIVCSE